MLSFSKCSIKDADTSLKEIIWKWRNQDHIRKMMFHQEYIGWEDHLIWFQNMVFSKNCNLKVFYYNNIPEGVITFKGNGNKSSEWGFYLGEKNHAKGLGTLLGIYALDEYFSDIQNNILTAQVLEFNAVSISFHKKMGFINVSIKKNIYEMNGEKYSIFDFLITREQWNDKRGELIKECRFAQ